MSVFPRIEAQSFKSTAGGTAKEEFLSTPMKECWGLTVLVRRCGSRSQLTNRTFRDSPAAYSISQISSMFFLKHFMLVCSSARRRAQVQVIASIQACIFQRGNILMKVWLCKGLKFSWKYLMVTSLGFRSSF